MDNCARLVTTPLAMGEGDLRNETCTQQNVHDAWNMNEVPNWHYASVANNSLNHFLEKDLL